MEKTIVDSINEVVDRGITLEQKNYDELVDIILYEESMHWCQDEAEDLIDFMTDDGDLISYLKEKQAEALKQKSSSSNSAAISEGIQDLEIKNE